MVIHNSGKTEDRLIGGTFDFAGKVQVHEMSMQNGIMKMRQLPSGLAIPPGGTVTLDPNGYHVMFMDLKRQLTQGETVKGDLDFEHAGKIAVEYKVGGMGDTWPRRCRRYGGTRADGRPRHDANADADADADATLEPDCFISNWAERPIALFRRMIFSEKSATFRDHALNSLFAKSRGRSPKSR